MRPRPILVSLAATLALLAGSATRAQERSSTATTALVFEAPRFELDRAVYLGDLVEHHFAFRNEGETEVIVVEVVDVGGTAEVVVDPSTIAPGASATVIVRQPMARLGQFNQRYAVLTDEPGRPRYRFTLSGFAQSAYDPEVVRLDFGWIDRAAGGKQRFELASREVERLELLGSDAAPNWLRLASGERIGVAGEGVAATLSLLPGAPLGLRSGTVDVRTNVAHQPVQRIAWAANIFGDVVPSANPVDLGLGREGDTMASSLRLESRTGTAFEILTVDDLPPEMTATYAPCGGGEAPSPCWTLEVNAASRTRAQLQGEMQVRLANDDERLPLRYRAIFVGRNTEIRQLEAPEAPDAGSEP